jgi:hypothetical protein
MFVRATVRRTMHRVTLWSAIEEDEHEENDESGAEDEEPA